MKLKILKFIKFYNLHLILLEIKIYILFTCIISIIMMIPENMDEEGLEYPEDDLDQMLDDELEVINYQ